MFDFNARTESLKQMQKQVFDLVIVGGGITGAGVARDAASRGMKVALVEAQDFSAGTSSRSSKLIHGGIRYLENLEFGLVFEALSERQKLFELAPHLVHPLKFILPLYEGGRVGMFKMGLGMWLYDMLALFDAPEMHRKLSPKQTTEMLPWLRSEHLLGSFSYYDAYMDDDRLVLETLRSAHSFGAQIANFTRALKPHFKNEKIMAIEAEDLRTGQKFEIRGRHFVAAAGPWTDQVCQHLVPQWKSRMRPTKGIHLTFRRERFPLPHAVVMALEKEDRIVFGIPRHDMVIVGTTDTDFREDPLNVHSTKADVSYLLQVANGYFPGAQLTQEDIVASYSGVRPLVADGSSSESKTSREHVIVSDPCGVTVVTGGKYTTYRHMAEQTVNECLKWFAMEDRVRFSRGRTLEPLNPLASSEKLAQARAQAESWSKEMRIPQELVVRAIERHGYEAVEILNGFQHWRATTSSLETAYWMSEADFAIDHSQCLRLVDFYLRRSPLFLSRPDHGFMMVDAIARVFTEKALLSSGEAKSAGYEIKKHMDHEMGWLSN